MERSTCDKTEEGPRLSLDEQSSLLETAVPSTSKMVENVTSPKEQVQKGDVLASPAAVSPTTATSSRQKLGVYPESFFFAYNVSEKYESYDPSSACILPVFSHQDYYPHGQNSITGTV